jgi:hypothetical protein
MQPTFQGIDISVAILMDDLACAKDIAAALRQQNILAYYYQTLEEYWVASSIQTPDLTIVDVTKMSQGSIQFRTHPKVIEKTLSYAFFSKDSTKILLQSTFGLTPIGYIHYDASLNAQIMCLISRRIDELKLMREKVDLESRVHRLQSRTQRLISERSHAEEFRANFDFIKEFCNEIEADSINHDYTYALIRKFENWEAIDAYGIYELNQSGQKLISPEISRKKYHPFPSLWLGQTNKNGIEDFAQEMAIQVVNDLFEIEPVLLKIHAGALHPDLLFFVSFKEERMSGFPWEVLQSMLSSGYRRLKLHQKTPNYASQFISTGEALDEMDALQRSEVETDSRILAVSFIPLTDVIMKKANNKFFWSAFFNDFFLQLSGRISKNTKFSLFGPWHMIIFVPIESVETEVLMLQNFLKDFSFWKFFEDNTQVLSQEMLPEIKLVPPSSSHYLKTFEKEFGDFSVNQNEKKLLSHIRTHSKRLTL